MALQHVLTYYRTYPSFEISLYVHEYWDIIVYNVYNVYMYVPVYNQSIDILSMALQHVLSAFEQEQHIAYSRFILDPKASTYLRLGWKWV